MTSTDWTRELQTALGAVRLASRACREVQAGIQAAALQKEDRSPVTVADFASQAIVCRAIHEAFPGDVIVGEESSADLDAPERRPFLELVAAILGRVVPGAGVDDVRRWIDAGRGDSGPRFWTVDPIDGTKGFLRGEQYAVALALIVEGRVQVGVLGCPNLPGDAAGGVPGSLFSAVRGMGAAVRPLEDLAAPARPVRVSPTSSPQALRMCESVESGHTAQGRSAKIVELLGTTAPAVRLDSQAKYAVVARGEADAYLRLPTKADYREKIWDHAAGALVAEEAGGRVTDVDGRDLEFFHGRELTANRGVIVTNGQLHAAVLEAVARTA